MEAGMLGQVEVSDKFVVEFVRRVGWLTRALADDMHQEPPGCLWARVEDMAQRGLLVIEGDVAREVVP
jgi:hypothetical protein